MTARLRSSIVASFVVVVLAGCSSTPPSPTAASASQPVPPGSPGSTGQPHPSLPTPSGRPPSIAVTRLPVQLPQAVSRAVAFSAASTVFVCGGLLGSGSTTASIVALDLAAGTTSVVGNLAVAVHDAAGASAGGHNLVFGGGNAIPVSTIQTCDATGTSAVVGSLPEARADGSAVTVTLPAEGMAAVVVGGAGAAPLPDALSTLDGRALSAIGRLVAPVRYAAVVAIGSSVIVIGGFRTGTETSDIQVLDLASGVDRIVGHLPGPLAHAAALVIAGRIVLAGGIRNGVRQRTVWSIDPATWLATRVAELPVALSDAAPVLIGGTGYLVGGETPSGSVASILELRPG